MMLVGMIACSIGAFAIVHSAQAFSACQCACLGTSNIQTFLRRAPTAGETCASVCSAPSENVCTNGSTLVNSYSRATTNGDRCACECGSQERTYLYRKLPTGAASCTNSCEATCRADGLQVDSTQNQTTNIRQIDCLTDADCTVGDFKYFKGIACVPQATTDTTNFPSGMRPTCVIPTTQENANIECQRFGGDAKGGNSTCTFVGSGDRPQAFNITRPYITTNGSYAVRSYTGQYTTPQALWTRLDADGAAPAGAQAGVCYRFGINGSEGRGGILQNQGDVTSVSLSEVANGTNTQNRYVCLVPKQSLCGSVDPPGESGTRPYNKRRSEYSCIAESTVLTNAADVCFPTNWTGTDTAGVAITAADLCTGRGTRCCTKPTCDNDADCGAFKRCTNGRCVVNPVCDTTNVNRRCRSASTAEQGNQDICTVSTSQFAFTSDPLLITDTLDSRESNGACPIPGQSCCESVNATALGNCAADKMNDQYLAGSWMNFSCVSIDEIPGGIPQDVSQNGPCLLQDVLSTVASPNGSPSTKKRCGGTKPYCCNVQALNLTRLVSGRQAGGAACGTKSFNCLATSVVAPQTEEELALMGYANRDAYYAAIAASPYCEMTPLFSGGYSSTEQCVNGFVCCSANAFVNVSRCPAGTDAECPSGQRCDAQVRVCVAGAVIEQRLASQSCAERAQAGGDTSVEFIAASSGAGLKDFTCQVPSSGNPTVGTRCLQRGCESEGENYRCCAPGTGASPVAGSTAVKTQTTAASAPWSLKLPPCIQNGQCTLDDLIWTGAQFANFLFAICGTVFLAIVVWGGVKFLKAGSQDATKDALGMIKNAVYGLVFMFAGFIIINFLQTLFIGSASGSKTMATCEALSTPGKNMACQFLNASADDASAINEEISQKQCVTGKCPGPKNYVCCPQ